MKEKKNQDLGTLLVSTKEGGKRALFKRALGFPGSFCEVYERAVVGRAEGDVHHGPAREFLLFYTEIVNANASSTSLFLYTYDTIYEIRGGQDRERALAEIRSRMVREKRAE